MTEVSVERCWELKLQIIRMRFVFSLVLSMLLLAAGTKRTRAADTNTEKHTRPNVLWIIAEDFGPQLSCYGTPEVRTPRLDALAAAGVRYTKAFTTTPVCSTSRSSFMTGMYSTTIGTHNHRSHRDDGYTLPIGVRVLTDWLRDAGYFTANVRHFAGEKMLRGTGKTDWNFTYQSKYKQPFDSDRWEDLAEHQPFYAQVNFAETHRGGAWDNSHKIIDRPADPARVELPPYYPDHPIARKDWAQYLNTAMALDKKVGMVLDRLERDGLADNTVVVFFGDHGRAHVRGKQWCYDSGLHIPLIIRWPRNFPAPEQFEPGSVDDRLIASIDLTATTLDVAGADKPDKMQGRIFLGERAEPARSYTFASRDRCDETVFRIRTVRDGRYRYIRNYMPERPFLQINRYKEYSYPMIPLIRRLGAEGKLNAVQSRLLADRRPAEELYDLASDPHETDNLAESQEHAAVLARLRQALDEWIRNSGDLGREPEPPEIAAKWEKRMEASYGQRLKKRQQTTKQRKTTPEE